MTNRFIILFGVTTCMMFYLDYLAIEMAQKEIVFYGELRSGNASFTIAYLTALSMFFLIMTVVFFIDKRKTLSHSRNEDKK